MLLLEAPKRAIKFGAFDFWGKTFRAVSYTHLTLPTKA